MCINNFSEFQNMFKPENNEINEININSQSVTCKLFFEITKECHPFDKFDENHLFGGVDSINQNCVMLPKDYYKTNVLYGEKLNKLMSQYIDNGLCKFTDHKFVPLGRNTDIEEPYDE